MKALPVSGAGVLVIALAAFQGHFSARGTPIAADDESVPAMMARIEGPQSPNRQGFDGLTLTQLMEKIRVPGVSVAVIKDFQVHWAKGYGTADVTAGTPVTTDTLFQAASISKPVAAMAALRLVQDGKLSLDADVNSLLKSWKLEPGEHTRDRPVTLRALLSHTSGLGDGFGFPGYRPGDPVPSVVQILERREAIQHRKSVDGAAAVHRDEVFRRRCDDRPARAHGHDRTSISRVAEEPRPRPDRHVEQRIRSAAVTPAGSSGRARAQRPRHGDGCEVARVPRARGCGPVDDADRSGAPRRRAAAGAAGPSRAAS